MLYAERNEEERRKFLEEIATIPPEKIIWMDESGIDEVLYRLYAYEKQGKRAYCDHTGKRVSRTTMIAGYRAKKTDCAFVF